MASQARSGRALSGAVASCSAPAAGAKTRPPMTQPSDSSGNVAGLLPDDDDDVAAEKSGDYPASAPPNTPADAPSRGATDDQADELSAAPPEKPKPRKLTPEQKALCERLARDPKVLGAIDQVLRGRVREADLPDVRQEVLIAVACSKALPTDPEALLQYIRGIGRKKAAQYVRVERRNVPVDHDHQVEQVAAAVPADPASARDMLAKLAKTVEPSSWKALTWFVRMTLGENLAKIAREEELDYDVVYKRTTKVRDDLRKTGIALGALAVLALVVGVVFHVLKPKQEEALRPPAPRTMVNDLRPAAPTQLEPRDPVATARDLRAYAFKECMRNRWFDCREDLDAAAWLDPAGDPDPAVQAARKDANEGTLHDKPGSTWQPPQVRVYAKLAAP